jgi:hypothetical protein
MMTRIMTAAAGRINPSPPHHRLVRHLPGMDAFDFCSPEFLQS